MEEINKRLAELIVHAESVFGSKEKAQRWLTKPTKSMSGLTPLELATQDDSSIEIVENRLEKISNGHY